VTDNTTPIATPEHTVEGFVREFLRELNFGQGTDLTRASVNDKYLAMARTVRHYLMVRWLATLRRQYQIQAKSVAYLSAEFLLGRQLDNALLASDLDEVVEEGLASLGDRLTLHSRAADRTSTLFLTLRDRSPLDVFEHLAKRDVLVPAGTFYAHETFRALGLSVDSGLRIGLAAYNDDSDVDRLLEGLTEVLS
jgi:hypothetical protein